MEFKLKTIGNYQSNDDLIYPFSLQSSDDLIVQRSKKICEVLSFNEHQNIIPSKLQLSSSKTEKPKEYPQLNVNSAKIIESCDLIEKNNVMLQPFLLPDCTLKNIDYTKCELSPFSERSGYVLACLTSSGMIELYKYDIYSCQLEKITINLSELRKSSLKKATREITKLEHLQKSFDEISFNSFEWCAIPFEDYKLLICLTNSCDLVFYNIQNDNVVEVKSMKVDAVENKLKWMDMDDKHYLLISTAKGNLIRYSIELGDEGSINDVQKVDEIEGKLKMPINFITIDYYKMSAIVLCCKGHSLEIFHVNGDKAELICTKYVDLTITGINVCDSLEYLLCTLNSRVYFMNLAVQNDVMSLNSLKKLEFQSQEDKEMICTDSLFGIATSKNNVLVYLSCFPQNAFDHLVNKQPNHISISLFTKYDPFRLLLNNPSLKLTDFVDCTEAIRYIGIDKLEMLAILEQMDYDISLNREFLYYLKIQLMVINIKLLYYQMKSRNIYESILQTKESIRELILVIHGQLLINSIINLKLLTETHYMVIRSLKKMIEKYCLSSSDKEPFRTALAILKPQLLDYLKVSAAKLKSKELPPEICDFCQQSIDDDELMCSSNHELKRCITTNLLVSIDCNNYCKHCRESASSSSLIIEVPPEINLILCPLCDSKLIFNE